jgi:hypothetical protein
LLLPESAYPLLRLLYGVWLSVPPFDDDLSHWALEKSGLMGAALTAMIATN